MRILSWLSGFAAVVFVVSAALGQDDLVAQGREVYMGRCEYCHGPGPQKGGTMTLQLRYQGAVPGVLAERTNLTPEYIRAVVRTATPGMTPIRITEVSEQDLEAVIAYLTRYNEP